MRFFRAFESWWMAVVWNRPIFWHFCEIIITIQTDSIVIYWKPERPIFCLLISFLKHLPFFTTPYSLLPPVKVMFLHLSVSYSVHRGVLPPGGCLLPGGATSRRGAFSQGVPPPEGVLPPGGVPGGDPPSPPGQLLLRAVRILLEFILVSPCTRAPDKVIIHHFLTFKN